MVKVIFQFVAFDKIKKVKRIFSSNLEYFESVLNATKTILLLVRKYGSLTSVLNNVNNSNHFFQIELFRIESFQVMQLLSSHQQKKSETNRTNFEKEKE